MSDLLATVIEAHGGLDRYNRFSSATVHHRVGGSLWKLKGREGILSHLAVRLDLHQQHASHYPFTASHLRTSFTAQRVAVETVTGEVTAERADPRASFPSDVRAPWDDLQVAYFAGEAMWTYLTSPFTFASPGFEAVELSPVTEEGRPGGGSRSRSLIASRRIALSRSSTSTRTGCCAGMTTRPRSSTPGLLRTTPPSTRSSTG